jgi:hypothetical protein
MVGGFARTHRQLAFMFRAFWLHGRAGLRVRRRLVRRRLGALVRDSESHWLSWTVGKATKAYRCWFGDDGTLFRGVHDGREDKLALRRKGEPFKYNLPRAAAAVAAASRRESHTYMAGVESKWKLVKESSHPDAFAGAGSKAQVIRCICYGPRNRTKIVPGSYRCRSTSTH